MEKLRILLLPIDVYLNKAFKLPNQNKTKNKNKLNKQNKKKIKYQTILNQIRQELKATVK